MPKINILDKSVYSLIAAGEVIDKPASVVKEMLENSIDAGASSVVIEIKGGGIDYIRVTDDGCGISANDMPIAFMPHTTSKILNAEDLYNISTLGFRGEALSTITAVSKVTMISKTKDSDSGNVMKIAAGEISQQEPIGSADGTTIISEDLFYNIPARKKFLRKPKLEEGEITNIVARIILSHPDIAIKYIADDKVIYNSSGTGLFDAIYSIYGKSVVGNLVPIDFATDTFKVKGYIGKVSFAKPNRTYQTLIVNGRYVINQAISTAIYKAYENYIMKSTFPFFVLNMEINNNLVDVNVHPNKLDIKFSNSSEIFETFVVEVSKTILDSINIENVTLTNHEDDEVRPEIDLSNLTKVSQDIGYSYTPAQTSVASNNNTQIAKPIEVTVSADDKNDDIGDEVLMSYDHLAGGISRPRYRDSGSMKLSSSGTLDIAKHELQQQRMFNSEKTGNNNIAQTNVINTQDIDKKYKIIGTLFDTFIVVQYSDYIYLIDQHAGHERVLFDKYSKEFENSSVCTQPMLMPFILLVNNIESNYIEDNIEVFHRLGFDIALFGDNRYRVSEIPLLLNNISLQSFFDEILAGAGTSKLALSSKDIIRDYLAKSACKHAIKANDKLDSSQIEYLLNLLEGTPVLLCPHGRPIVLKITEKEIEKWFKRIV